MLPGIESVGTAPALGEMTGQEAAITDISSTGVSAESYPTQFLRDDLAGRGILKVSDLGEAPVGERVRAAEAITYRQCPWTATGVTFISLENETGILNAVCSTELWDRYRQVIRRNQDLTVRRMVERGDGAVNFIADALEPLVFPVQTKSWDFRQPTSFERRSFAIDEQRRLVIDRERGPTRRVVHISLTKTLFRATYKAGPVALLAVVQYGLELQKLVKDNPRVVESITERFCVVAGAREGPSDKKSPYHRVEVLHRQVTYVYASTNTSDAACQAAKWREEPERIDHAIPIVESMSGRGQSAERKKLIRKLDGISVSAPAATVEDAVENAQIVEGGDEVAGAGDSRDGRTGGAAGDDGSAKNSGSARNDGSAGSGGLTEEGGAEAN